MDTDLQRRGLLSFAGIALALPAVRAAQGAEAEDDEGVDAVEDLMREHGVLRRALLVYAEAASRLSSGRGDVPTPALRDTAELFRRFGEEYHERALEEQHVFPVLARAGGANAAIASTLKQQHDRGRQITDYVSAVARRDRLADADRRPLGATLASFVRMYEHHAAIEDTVILPAWKAAISRSQYEALSEQFEELEHRMFGRDGFEDAVERISRIEQAFGVSDLAGLTAPAPPKPSA
jgi:hemerythrin-like domain-containing protein